MLQQRIMVLMLHLLCSAQTGTFNLVIGNVNNVQAEIMTTHMLLSLLMIAKVSLITRPRRPVICTIMEYVLNNLQLLLTTSTMPLQVIEKDHLKL
jgi:hypothetical protein